MLEVMAKFVEHSFVVFTLYSNTVYSYNQIIPNSVLILAYPYSQFEDKHLNDS